MSDAALTAIAYAFVAVFGLFAAGLVAFLQWHDGRQPSTVALSAGTAALGVMTFGATVIGHLLQ